MQRIGTGYICIFLFVRLNVAIVTLTRTLASVISMGRMWQHLRLKRVCWRQPLAMQLIRYSWVVARRLFYLLNCWASC